MKEIIDTHYASTAGQGDPVLFLPAGGFSGNEGQLIADQLTSSYTVHLLDLPGFGKSKGLGGHLTSRELAEWVNSYVEAHSIEKVHLIGHSLGGAIALAFAVHFPSKVHCLILLDQGHKSFPRIPTSEYGPLGLAFPVLNMLHRLFGRSLIATLESLFIRDKTSYQGRELSEDQLSSFCTRATIPKSDYVRLALATPAHLSYGGLNLFFGYYNLNLPEMMNRLTVPTLLIYADFCDVSVKEAELTANSIDLLQNRDLPVTYHRVPGGHFVHWSPDFPIETVQMFLGVTK